MTVEGEGIKYFVGYAVKYIKLFFKFCDRYSALYKVFNGQPALRLFKAVFFKYVFGGGGRVENGKFAFPLRLLFFSLKIF